MFGRILLAFMECFGIYKRQVRVGDIFVYSSYDGSIREVLGVSGDRINYLIMYSDGYYSKGDYFSSEELLDEKYFYYLGNIND